MTDENGNAKQSPPMQWYWFLVLFALPMAVARSIIRWIVAPEFWLLCAFDIAFQAAFAVGLAKLKPWGWFLSLLVPIIQAVTFSLAMGSQHGVGGAALALFMMLCLWSVPNCIYFYRLKAMFGVGLVNFDRGLPTFLRPYGLVVNKGNDEAAYAEAYDEATGDNRKKELWAKAFAQSDGDEHRAQAMYIRLRVEQAQRLDTANTINIDDSIPVPSGNVCMVIWIAFFICQGFAAHASLDGGEGVIFGAIAFGAIAQGFWLIYARV